MKIALNQNKYMLESIMCIQQNSPGSQPEENMIGVSCLDTLLLRRYFLLFLCKMNGSIF